MKIKVSSMSFVEKAFYVLWTIFSVVYFLLHETEIYYMFDTDKILNIIVRLTILSLLFVLFLKNQYSKETIIKYALFLILVTLIELSIKNQIFLVYILFIMVAQFIDFNRFVKFDLTLKAIIFLMVILLCLLGVLENYSTISEEQIKYSLGFTHPNKFCCFAFTILVEWIYVRFERIKIWEWILMFILCNIVKEIGASRTMYYVFVLILLLFILAKIKEEIFYHNIVRLIFVIITPVMAIVSFVTTHLYSKGNQFMYVLDDWMTHRLRFQSEFLEKYDIKFFGQNIELIGTRGANLLKTERLILDNAYIRCALMYGLIFFVMLCLIYSVLMYQFLQKKRVELAILSLFFVLYAFGESYALSVLYNITLLCFLGINQMKIEKKEKINKKHIKIRIKL